MAQIRRVTHDDSPGIVNHHRGVFRNRDRFSCHRDDRCNRRCEAIDSDVNIAPADKQIENGDAVKNVAARRIDCDR